MLDRAMEAQHLRLADEHLQRAHDLIGRLEDSAENVQRRGSDVWQACRSLSAIGDLLSRIASSSVRRLPTSTLERSESA